MREVRSAQTPTPMCDPGDVGSDSGVPIEARARVSRAYCGGPLRDARWRGSSSLDPILRLVPRRNQQQKTKNYYSLCACRRTAFCWIGIFLVESGKFLILDGNFAAGATGKIGNEGNPDLGRHTAPLPSLTPVASMNAESSVMEAER